MLSFYGENRIANQGIFGEGLQLAHRAGDVRGFRGLPLQHAELDGQIRLPDDGALPDLVDADAHVGDDLQDGLPARGGYRGTNGKQKRVV